MSNQKWFRNSTGRKALTVSFTILEFAFAPQIFAKSTTYPGITPILPIDADPVIDRPLPNDVESLQEKILELESIINQKNLQISILKGKVSDGKDDPPGDTNATACEYFHLLLSRQILNTDLIRCKSKFGHPTVTALTS